MSNWRLNLIFFLFVFFGLAIIGRLFYLQVLRGDYYRAIAHGQQKTIKEVNGERGRIFFNGGQILAANEEGKFLYVSPKEIKDKEETARAISEIINFPEIAILEKIKKDDYFELLKPKLTVEEINSLKKLNLKGIYLGDSLFRNYPQASMASQVVGFLSGERGQYGVEGYYDEILKGRGDLQEKLRTPWGYLTSSLDQSATKGADIWLTIDYNIQFRAEELLQEAKKNFDIESGQIIVMEPSSGKILTLANFPNFDPNQYQKYANEEKFALFQNSAIQKIFEPGSAFKPITMAAALEEGRITPQTTYIDEGKVQIKSRTLYNFDKKKWGERTMTEVLEKSINTGAVFAQRQIGDEKFLKYIELFKFFEPTGIDLEGETFSVNPGLKKGKEINFATAAFGQGIEMTPLQLARAFSAIANRGKIMKPYIVELTEVRPQSIPEETIISQKTASQLTAMLVNVVENGYGKKAKVPGYYIAGKTGTAQVPYENKRGYEPDKTIQSFVGFGPAFEPKFLILIKLDNPKTRTAEYSAAPIFGDLAKYIIDYLEIPPDYE
ncbi:penicillin-binding protein 2 [Patescibacteria group bacterium]|nr:penicillin-binding protein 2 [Patescibacteria group bacterium]